LPAHRPTVAFAGEADEQPTDGPASASGAARQAFLAGRRRRRDRDLTLLRVWERAAAAVRVLPFDEADLPEPFVPNSTRPTLSKASAEARNGSVTSGFIVSACLMFSNACRQDL
jgi:hypothetical protein